MNIIIPNISNAKLNRGPKSQHSCNKCSPIPVTRTLPRPCDDSCNRNPPRPDDDFCDLPCDVFWKLIVPCVFFSGGVFFYRHRYHFI